MTRALVLSVALLLGCTCRADPADCGIPSRREAFRRAAVVFRGVVTAIEDPDRVDAIDPVKHQVVLQPIHPEGQRIVTFRVSRGWKGAVSPTMKVLTYLRSKAFDTYVFTPGVEYVVYGLESHFLSAASRKLAGGQPVYAVSEPCLQRVRTDVAQESKALGGGRPPHDPSHE
jgi:hypothetical protein